MNTETALLPSRVLFFDGSIAIVSKKIGEICETEVKDKTLSLIANCKPDLQTLQSTPISWLQAVHRIDQPVSGCVLLALDKKTHASLSLQFSQGRIRKKYLAIVEMRTGETISASGRLEHYLRFDTKHHKTSALFRDEIQNFGPDWKKAVLDWKLLGSGERYHFLEVEPLTGRTHQIRAQLARAGMSIKGDLKYGARRSDPLGGIRLHAWKIQFTHPETGDVCTVACPIDNPDALWRSCLEYVK